MENLVGDLLFGFKFVKLSILPTLFIHFVWHRLGELMSRYLGIKGLNFEIGGISYEFHFHEKHFWATKYNQ